MAKSGWMIVVGPNAWQLVELSEVENPARGPVHYSGPVAEEPIADALREAGYRSGFVLVALGSDLCLAADVPIPNARFARKRQAMLYSLEAYVPWAAEDYVADWTVAGGQAFMVAAEAAELLPLIEKLESEGFPVRSVTPLAVLAARDACGRKHAHIAIWGDRELFIIRDGGIRQWQTLKSTNCHSLRLQQLLATEELPVEKYDGLLESAARQAAKIVRGKEEATVELRRGQLESGAANQALRGYRAALFVAASLLLIVTGGVLWMRAQTHADWAERLDDRQAAIFEDTFPGVRVPVGIRTRLAAEVKRLKGVRGSDTELPERTEVLSILHGVLAALPQDMRYRILEIRIEDGRLNLVGEVRTHSDADLIAAALRAQGLQVAAPSTHRLPEQGVEFRISGEWRT